MITYLYPLESRLLIGSFSLTCSVAILYLISAAQDQSQLLLYALLGIAVILLTNGCALLVTVLVEITRRPTIEIQRPTSRPLSQTATPRPVPPVLPPVLPPPTLP